LGSGRTIFGERYRRAFPDLVPPLETAAQVAEAVEVARGVGWSPLLKVYGVEDRLQRRRLQAVARQLGAAATGEGGCNYSRALQFALDGYHGFEHAIPEPVYDDVSRLLAAAEVFYTPTLLVACGSGGAVGWYYSRMRADTRSALEEIVPEEWLEWLTSHWPESPDAAFLATSARVSQFSDHGVRISVGGHGQLPGVDMLWEMMAMQQGGMSPSAVLEAATTNGAAKLGMENAIGTLRQGYRADILILRSDPRLDVGNLRDLVAVVTRGTLVDVNTLGRRPG
jgi:hypothetical protein